MLISIPIAGLMKYICHELRLPTKVFKTSGHPYGSKLMTFWYMYKYFDIHQKVISFEP